jgi:hypothetical protein
LLPPQPIQIERKVPALICGNCARDVDAADSLRLQILDADDYFLVLSREIESKYWKAQKATFNQVRNQRPTRAVAVKSTSSRVHNPPPPPSPPINAAAAIKQEIHDPEYDDDKNDKTLLDTPMDAKVKEEPQPLNNNSNNKRKLSSSPEVVVGVPSPSPQPPPILSVTTTTSTFSKRQRKMPSKFDSSFLVEKVQKKTKPPPKSLLRLSVSSSGSDNINVTAAAAATPTELKSCVITLECDKCKTTFDDMVKFNSHLAIHRSKYLIIHFLSYSLYCNTIKYLFFLSLSLHHSGW